jgi:hypothetical protein
MQIIRQQRHLGVRVMIATQEPTLDTRLLDLCNVVIVHHFQSPQWFRVIKNHLAGGRGGKDKDDAAEKIFKTIVTLETGHALVFAPRAVLHIRDRIDGEDEVGTLGDCHVKIKMRGRLTTDGGMSITAKDAVELSAEETPLSDEEDEETGGE